jgi:hypothetical protein
MFGEILTLNSWINPLPHHQTNMFFLVLNFPPFAILLENRERPRTAWYSDRKDEEHVISMVAQMGLHMDAFVSLADALIEDRNMSAHFGFGECGRKVSACWYLFHRFPQLKSQLPHHANIIELFGGPGETIR